VRFSLLILGTALGCASAGPPVSPPPPAPPPPPPPAIPWTLVWADEFSGATGAGVDTAYWRYDVGDGCAQSNCGWGNNEKEYYRSSPENIAHTGGGYLAIVARVATDSLPCYYGRCRYTSAKITTRGKVSVLPGRVEARIQLARGQGLWPAFWMLGTNIGTVGWPTCGELDILENKGSQPGITSSAVHGPGYSGNTPFAHTQANLATEFHLYAVEWDAQSIRYYVDTQLHYTVSRGEVQPYGAWVFDQPFYVILNQAVGGHFDGDPQSDSILPATMLVDYVRVYRRNP
jgi:beta-glucanase (GH16 family)